MMTINCVLRGLRRQLWKLVVERRGGTDDEDNSDDSDGLAMIDRTHFGVILTNALFAGGLRTLQRHLVRVDSSKSRGRAFDDGDDTCANH